MEKATAGSLLARYDWYVVRKAEKSTAIPSAITTYRDAVRTACDTREKEIDACSDTAALVTLYGSTEQSDKTFKPNMTQYPVDPNE
jgi:predicted Zn-dependent protease with MMP-like domain